MDPLSPSFSPMAWSPDVLCLSALGLTLVFGLMRVVNFAHGDFMWWVDPGWLWTDLVGFNFFLTLAIVIFSLAVGGYLIDRLLIARVRGRGRSRQSSSPSGCRSS